MEERLIISMNGKELKRLRVIQEVQKGSAIPGHLISREGFANAP